MIMAGYCRSTFIFACMAEGLKAPYSSKIDFLIKERFNKLIYGINTIKKSGI